MIKIYTKPNCQPCIAAKRKMKEKGIEFIELPALEHSDYLTSLGYRSAPVTVTEDLHWYGYRPDLLDIIENYTSP